VNQLERTFLDMATERGLLSVDQRDQVEAACARAKGEGQNLRPWRAVFVRGHLTRPQVDTLLAEATARVEGGSELEDGDESSISAEELSASAEDEGLDYRLGILAIQTGVVTEEQLEASLAAQRKKRAAGKRPKRLGEVLVEEGHASPSLIEGLVLLQARLREQGGRETDTTHEIAAELRFGQVALDARVLSERDLARALAEEKRRSAKGGPSPFIGDILIEQGAMTREAVDLVLELQERRSSRPSTQAGMTRVAPEDLDKIGSVLVDSRLVSEAQVRSALELQRELKGKGIDRRLGDLLVLQGAIDRPALETVLKAQVVRRKAPIKRRRSAFREELLPENPATVLLAVVLAAMLSSVYVVATDGTSLILRALVSAPGAQAPDSPRKQDERSDPPKPG
jgi:hypothetical protein